MQGVGLGLSREQALQMAAQTFQSQSNGLRNRRAPSPLAEMQFVALVALPRGEESIVWNKSAYEATLLQVWKQPYKRTQVMGKEAGQN